MIMAKNKMVKKMMMTMMMMMMMMVMTTMVTISTNNLDAQQEYPQDLDTWMTTFCSLKWKANVY